MHIIIRHTTDKKKLQSTHHNMPTKKNRRALLPLLLRHRHLRLRLQQHQPLPPGQQPPLLRPALRRGEHDAAGLWGFGGGGEGPVCQFQRLTMTSLCAGWAMGMNMSSCTYPVSPEEEGGELLDHLAVHLDLFVLVYEHMYVCVFAFGIRPFWTYVHHTHPTTSKLQQHTAHHIRTCSARPARAAPGGCGPP